MTFRDFNRAPSSAAYTKHPDFETYAGNNATLNMVQTLLGVDGKPVYTGICETGNNIGPCPYGNQTTSKTYFDQWYRDTANVNI